MRLDFERTRADFESAAATHWRRLERQPNPYKKLIWLCYVVAGVGLILVADEGARKMTWLAPSLLIVVGIGFPAWMAWAGHSVREKQWREADHVLGPVVYDFSEEQIAAKGQLSESVMRWELFRNWAEGGGAFLLYQTPNTYVVIPKRVFKSDTDMAEFRGILRRKLAEPVRGFPVQIREQRRG
jgi:hypothetical protein